MFIRSSILLAIAICATAKLCPNPQYQCAETATCCLLADDIPPGEYGCCPMPDAICCEDRLHCCPSGATCDVEQGTCAGSQGEITRMHKKHRAQSSEETMEEEEEEKGGDDVVCPDQRSQCPPETTCCQLETGKYGCCPSPHAMCCADHLHCCPDGYRCDASGERCRQNTKDIFGGKVIESLRKFPASPRVVKQAIEYRDVKARMTATEKQKRPVQCGKAHGCSRGHTCCEQYDDENGPYPEPACCPMGEATCCTHGCCPKGYSCTQDGRSCQKNALTEDEQYLQLLKKSWD